MDSKEIFKILKINYNDYQIFLNEVDKSYHGRINRYIPKEDPKKKKYLQNYWGIWDVFCNFRHHIEFIYELINFDSINNKNKDEAIMIYFLSSVSVVVDALESYKEKLEFLFEITELKNNIKGILCQLNIFKTLRKFYLHPSNVKLRKEDKESYSENPIIKFIPDNFLEFDEKNLIKCVVKDNYTYSEKTIWNNSWLRMAHCDLNSIIVLNDERELHFRYLDLINNFNDLFNQLINKYNCFLAKVNKEPHKFYKKNLNIQKARRIKKNYSIKFKEYVVNNKNENQKYFDLKIYVINNENWKSKITEIILEYVWIEDNELKNIKRVHGVRWHHKGCNIGKLIKDHLNPNQGFYFKNCLLTDHFSYNLSQPDIMILDLFLRITKLIKIEDIYWKYVNIDWFEQICGVLPSVKYFIEQNYKNNFNKRILNSNTFKKEICIILFKSKDKNEWNEIILPKLSNIWHECNVIDNNNNNKDTK